MGDWLNQASFSQLVAFGAAFFLSLTTVAVLGSFAIERVAQARGLTIYALPVQRGQKRQELYGTAVFHAVFVPLWAYALANGWIRFGTSLAAEVATFFASWIGFQVYFWFLHRAMHTRSLFWIHHWHHESLITTPLTGFSMGPLEAVGWTVGFLYPAMVLTATWEVGAWGWLAFFVMAFMGNVAGHANAEFLPPRATSRASNPIMFHALHHSRFTGHYGFGASYMDALMGSEFPDWPALHRRILAGEPLRSLRDHGATAVSDRTALAKE